MGRVEGHPEGISKQRSNGKSKNGRGTEETATGGEGDASDRRIDAAERLTIELARLRSKFGADPAIARASLEDAWMSPTAAMEEDEAEFIDAVAGCMGVGLSLDAALNCWDSGGLFYDDAEDDDTEGISEEETVRETVKASLPAAHTSVHVHLHPGARRLLVP
jgi:hypothetical protein